MEEVHQYNVLCELKKYWNVPLSKRDLLMMILETLPKNTLELEGVLPGPKHCTMTMSGPLAEVLHLYLKNLPDGQYMLKVPELMTLKTDCEKVKWLKTLDLPAQRTPEWYCSRYSSVTASATGTVLNMNKYDKPKKVLLKKCGLGEPFNGNEFTRWGQKYEDAAIAIFAKRMGVTGRDYGLILHPLGLRVAASPDWITDCGIMVEIKCPSRRKLFEMNGITPKPIPPYYWAQIQQQLQCCNLTRARFVEAKFIEYESEDAFRADESTERPGYRATGEEKGCILQWGDQINDTAIFRHSPVGLSWTGLKRWINKTKFEEPEGFKGVKPVPTYWGMTEYVCRVVNRDDEWFEEVVPKLGAFWDDVRRHRSNGCYELKQESNSTAKVSSNRTATSDDTIMLLDGLVIQ